MEFVGEDLAALDAALAFLDEWDLDSMEDRLGALHVAPTRCEAAAPALAAGGEQQQEQREELRRMLEPEPFVTGDVRAKMTIPLATEPASAGCGSATATAAASGAGGSPVVKSEPSALSPPRSATMDSDWDGGDASPVDVDDKPRCKKKRRDDAAAAAIASQDPRALALQSVNLRVKRRRQKEELLELRQKVQQLETRLSQIKTKSSVESPSSPSSYAASGAAGKNGALVRETALETKPHPTIQHRSPLGAVWERLAARQLKERERAEEENQRLKDMLDEHVKLARSLDRILRKRATSQRLSPDGMVISGREHTGETPHEDISRVNNLVIDLEGLYSGIDMILSRFGITEQLQTPYRDTKLRKEERDGVFLESMDSRVLPFDMRSTGATVWQFLAESGGEARIYYQNCTNMTEDIRTCTYGVEVQHKETKAAFWGTSAMRKYVENGRIVISWSGQFEPVKSCSDPEKCGYVFRHKGWVDITPSILNPTEAVVMQSYYRIAPELAGDGQGDAGAQDTDPNEKISALMDFVIATTDSRLDASHQFIENLLMQQAEARGRMSFSVNAAADAHASGAGAQELSLEEALAFFDGYDDPTLLQTSGGMHSSNSGEGISADFIANGVFMQSSGGDGRSAMNVDMTVGGGADFGMMASMLQPLHLEDSLLLSAVEPTANPMQTLLTTPLIPAEVANSSNKSSATQSKATRGKANGSPKLRQSAKSKAAISQTQTTTQATARATATSTPMTTMTVVPRGIAKSAAGAAAGGSTVATSNSTSTKRVRRQKEELLYLRTKVVELEERLQQLKRVNGEMSSTRGSPAPSSGDDAGSSVEKASPSSSPARTATSTSAASTNAHPSPAGSSTNSRKKRREEDSETDDAEGESSPSGISPALLASVWENVADRQYKERLRAEQQNKKLKTMLEGQIKLATSLEKILKKRPNMEVLYPDTECSSNTGIDNKKPPTSQRAITYEMSDEELFKKQLEDIGKAYVRVDDVMASAGFFHSEETRHDFRIKDFPDEDGMLMEFMATTTVPFDLHITGNALWRFMSDVAVKKHCYFEEIILSTEDTSSRKFGVRLSENGQNVDLRGKHTMRKYIEAERIVLVWTSHMEPIQLAGAKVRGLRFNDVGWIIAERSSGRSGSGSAVSRGSGGATVIKAYGHMSPCIPDESEEDQDEQIGALTDFVINCHESNAALCVQLINDLLVEEEWKTTLPVTL